VHQTFERHDRPRAAAGSEFLKKLDGFQYTKWALFGLHLALNEPVRLHSEKFDPNIHRTLKWSLGAETMDDLMAAHGDVVAGRMPEIIQFGAGPLSVLDPTQAPPGKATQYAWHVMPYEPDLGGQDHEDFKREFADKIIEKWSKYASNMTRRNILGQYVYTPREYVGTFPQMRGGDIFMGAFNAEQVMYDQARSKRSAFITLVHAATKSFTNFSFESAQP
jgi:phytoene dehydrogenase-like protein